jgi:hypothetical protein
MHRIDNTTSSTTLPTTKPVGNPGFFTAGTVGGQEATIVEADWLNTVQEELAAIVAAAGVPLAKSNNGQVIAAILSLLASNTRRRLTAPLDLYVSPSGSDTNDGLTSGTAFATPQAAWNYIMEKLDVGAQTITVHLAHGTYGHTSMLGTPVGSEAGIIFRGDPTTPAAVVIAGNNNNAVDMYGAMIVSFDGVTIQATGTAQNSSGFNVQGGAQLRIQNMNFGPTAGTHLFADMGSIIQIAGPYSISGGGDSHLGVASTGIITIGGNLPNFNFTLTGTPHFAGAFAMALQNGTLSFGRPGYTWVGGATGRRFNVNTNAVIRADGYGLNYFPGDIPGIVDTATYGVYVA